MGLPVFNGTLSFQLPQFVFHQICWESSFRHRKLIPATVELRHWQWVCSCTDAWVCVFAGPLRTRRLQLAQLRYPSISQLASQPADSTRPANKYPLASIYTHTHTHTHTVRIFLTHCTRATHAGAVLAMAPCLSATSRCSVKTSGRIEFWHGGFLWRSIYHSLFYNDIQVSTKVRALPSVELCSKLCT